MKEGEFELFKIQERSFRVRHSRFGRQAMVILIAVLFVAANLMTPVKAAPGDLDPSFGNGGLVTTDFFGNFEWDRGLAVQADGKIVAAGKARDNLGADQFAIARYNPDGSLDQAFGSSGKVTTSFPSQISSDAEAVTIQTDGKILAGGIVIPPASCASCSILPQFFALARYNTDGTLDSSFGSGGTATFNPGFSSGIEALAVQPDGRIIAAGFTLAPLPSVGFDSDFVLMRLNPDGSPDSSFGLQGVVITDFFPNSGGISAVALQTDGRIVAVGRGGPAAESTGFTVVRYNADGSLDNSFGVGGIVNTQLGPLFSPGGTDILSDGRILVGGGDNFSSAAIVRYNTDGSLDPTFGIGGIALAAFPAYRMAVLPNSKIISAGTFSTGLATGHFSVSRFNADGSLDPTFGNGGNVQTETAFFHSPFAAAAVPYGNDRVIVGGWLNTAPFGFALARYLGDSGAAGDVGVTMSPVLSLDANGNLLITYTIAVANNGPDPSYYVTLNGAVPPGTVFQSLSVPPDWVVYQEPAVGRPGPISVSKSVLSGRLTDPAIFTLVVRVTQHHRAIPNHVSISSSSTPDPNGSNNQAHTVTRVP